MKGFVESLAGSCRGGAVVVEEDAERRRGGRMEDESLLAEFETRSRAISPWGLRATTTARSTAVLVRPRPPLQGPGFTACIYSN